MARRWNCDCLRFEIDPLYVDTAIRRWQKHSGAAAVNGGTGESFNEREEKVSNV
jgi:hypothetical protein